MSDVAEDVAAAADKQLAEVAQAPAPAPVPETVGCMDCKDNFDVELMHKYGTHFKCKWCHSSYRFCRDNVPSWSTLSAENKAAYVVANRKSGGRGKKRELVAAQCVLGLQS